MDILKEDKLLALELNTLSDEALKRSKSLENDAYQPRRIFALAQVVGSTNLLQYLLDHEEWSEFGEDLEGMLEGVESRYYEAKEADDREAMNVSLAHRRLIKRLMRRLTDPRRRQMLLPQLESQQRV